MYNQEEILCDIKYLKSRMEEVEAIAISGESPFQHLSLIKSNITDILQEISNYNEIKNKE